MKGISSVIAIILILLIVISLAALAYMWFMDIFGILTGTAGEAAGRAGETLGTEFMIESAKNDTVSSIMVVLRNTGTVNIDMTKIAVYLDGNYQDPGILEGNVGTLSPDDVRSFNITNVVDTCSRILKVTVPAGKSDITTTEC